MVHLVIAQSRSHGSLETEFPHFINISQSWWVPGTIWPLEAELLESTQERSGRLWWRNPLSPRQLEAESLPFNTVQQSRCVIDMSEPYESEWPTESTRRRVGLMILGFLDHTTRKKRNICNSLSFSIHSYWVPDMCGLIETHATRSART